MRSFAPISAGFDRPQIAGGLSHQSLGEGLCGIDQLYRESQRGAAHQGVLGFLTVERLTEVMGDWVADSLKDAGMIILITGAGGLERSCETAIADFITTSLSGMQLGVLLPFALAAALKPAGVVDGGYHYRRGLSRPGRLGLAGGIGPALAVMAIGAGAMTVSHANDSYFWVVAQFSDMKVSEAYRLQTLASLVTGIVGLITVTILYVLFV